MPETARSAPDSAFASPRPVIENVRPEIDGGRFPVKRVVGEKVVVEADVFCDGHDVLVCELAYRRPGDGEPQRVRMEPIGNDRWRAEFAALAQGELLYTVRAWIDRFRTWRHDLARKAQAGQDVSVDLLAGADLLDEARRRASAMHASALATRAAALRSDGPADDRVASALSTELLAAMDSVPPEPGRVVRYERELRVLVERVRARFSAWYELFPRSSSSVPGRHGTLRDTAERVRYAAAMGFDIVYFPPIHPIGRTHRKGRNNALVAAPDDVGSPWAIGAAEGGHTEIHPALGTREDFRALLRLAESLGVEIALDIAFQCSADHPWVREHPTWFRWRPDGKVQYAENPPKRYEDIYPFDFESRDWRGLWEALRDVFLHWAGEGVRVFRVDNPHTKPFAFWEWALSEVRRRYPDAIFLSEAFTRPKVMQRLAKLGFTQSYTYFTWRNTKAELVRYLTELNETELRDVLRPCFWPNTPDILPEYLQLGGHPAFIVRVVLAATLAASYGVYGPAYELGENRAREPGSEEYMDSEKYQLRAWDLTRPDSLRELLTRLNRIRRENPALQSNDGLRFHPVDNDQVLAFSKSTADRENIVVVVVSLDPHHRQSGFLELPLEPLGLDPWQPFQVHDLLTGARYLWSGPRNYVEIDPHGAPVHVLRVRRRVRTEHDFDYFL